MYFLASTRVNVRISNSSQASAINLVRIQPSKSSSQIYNTQILLKRPKTAHFSKIIEQKLHFEKFYLDNKESSSIQEQRKLTILAISRNMDEHYP